MPASYTAADAIADHIQYLEHEKKSAEEARYRAGPRLIQLFHYVKRSEAYHSLSPDARAFLLELIDRHTGTNNGFIRFGVREAMYELGIKSMGRTSAIMREVDDAGLARPTQVGAWRGKKPTEWRLMWLRCQKTGDLPVQSSKWKSRKPFHEFHKRNAKVPNTENREDVSSEYGTRNGKISISDSGVSSTRGT